jgi:TolB-like protein
MTRLRHLGSSVLGVIVLAFAAAPSTGAEKAPEVYPVAVIQFEERGSGAKELGPKVTDLMFAKLVSSPELFLVDRGDMKKAIDEQTLSVVGAVNPEQVTRVGQLTGAKIIVTGSVIHADKQLILVAKVIGVETTRVLGASVEGRMTDELSTLVGRLATEVSKTITEQSEKLVPPPSSSVDKLEKLREEFAKIKAGTLPKVYVQILEGHVGALVIDPAAQIEISRWARELGFTVIDNVEGNIGKADVIIRGEAFSEVCGRLNSLVAVKGRMELKLIERTSGNVIAADRQTAVVLDATELVGGKQALQNAAAILALRNLPKLKDFKPTEQKADGK